MPVEISDDEPGPSGSSRKSVTSKQDDFGTSQSPEKTIRRKRPRRSNTLVDYVSTYYLQDVYMLTFLYCRVYIYIYITRFLMVLNLSNQE